MKMLESLTDSTGGVNSSLGSDKMLLLVLLGSAAVP